MYEVRSSMDCFPVEILWTSTIGQELYCKCEVSNAQDAFAVMKALLLDTFCGHFQLLASHF